MLSIFHFIIKPREPLRKSIFQKSIYSTKLASVFLKCQTWKVFSDISQIIKQFGGLHSIIDLVKEEIW